ncbi:hypothetical protein Tco_1445226 [Tanacetum coccineum]
MGTERNERHFTNEKQSCKDLIENVVYYIRLKLASLTVKRTDQVEEVSRKWKVVFNVKKNDVGILQVIAMLHLNILELTSVRNLADYNRCIKWPRVGLVSYYRWKCSYENNVLSVLTDNGLYQSLRL